LQAVRERASQRPSRERVIFMAILIIEKRVAVNCRDASSFLDYLLTPDTFGLDAEKRGGTRIFFEKQVKKQSFIRVFRARPRPISETVR
jgi:hypothetical protein